MINRVIKKEDVLKALSTVIDPDFKKDLVSLGMIKDVEVLDHKISFTVELTTPACPLKEIIRGDCLKAVSGITGDGYEIDINMSSNVTSVIDESPILPDIKNIIAVASGKGG